MLVALGASALGATAARALSPEPLGLAQHAAEEVWGNAPCGGQVAVLWQQGSPPPAIPGTEVEAWVTFQTPDGVLDFAAPPSTYSQCTVYINQLLWPSYESTVQAYPQFCQMIVHEYGHFEGYADSTKLYRPTDIRYPVLTEANLPVPCRYEFSQSVLQATFRPGLRDRVRAGASRVKLRCFEIGCARAAAAREARKR